MSAHAWTHNAGHLAGLPQRVQEETAVIVVCEDGLAAVSACHPMAMSTGIMETETSGQENPPAAFVN